MGAYDVLKRLKAEGMKPQLPVAYRALKFLETHSFARRIERLNAFVAYMRPEEKHFLAFMICRVCRRVAEAAGPPELPRLVQATKNMSFEVDATLVELQGLYHVCRVIV